MFEKCLLLGRQLVDALAEMLGDDHQSSTDVSWRVVSVLNTLPGDAMMCRTATGVLVQRLEQIFAKGNRSESSQVEFDAQQIHDTSRRLMAGFQDREIANFVEDGQGGSHRERTDRIRKQRIAAKKGAEQSGPRFPQELDPWLVVQGDRSGKRLWRVT
jgi:hypothetical protein